jgi:hypothetical protein
MNKKKGWKGVVKLAGMIPLTIASAAFAVVPERPHPENFPDYSKYIQALFDYERAQEAAQKEKKSEDYSASKLCQDGGDSPEKKKNSCEGKELLGEHRVPLKDHHESEPLQEKEKVAYEDLDEAIARAQIQTPGLVEHSGNTRSTFESFPLAEIPGQDLSQSGVSGLLGLFNTVGLKTPPSTTTARLRPYSTASLDPNNDLKLTLDDLLYSFTKVETYPGGFLQFGNGYTIFSSTVGLTPTGLNISLSAETYISPLYIVDRDGLDGGPFDDAGALTIDHLSIIVPRLDITMQGFRNTDDNSLLQLDINSPKNILVNLSNTHIGAADARADGSQIGISNDFLVFGPNSILTVAAGTSVTADLGNPSQGDPFLTLNGHIGDITLPDISLISRGLTALNIGRLTLRNINLVNTRVYVEDEEVSVDAGTGLTNVGIGIERLYIGSAPAGGRIGDIYMDNTQVHNLQFSAVPH